MGNLNVPQLQDITEISKEWILHSRKYTKFTIIINVVYGKPTVRYGAYRDDNCKMISSDLEAVFNKYASLADVAEEKVIPD